MITGIMILFGGCAGAVSTYYIQKMGCTPVIASCLIGLAGALLGYLVDSEDLAMVIFAGTFVGMTTVSIATLPIMVSGGLLCGILYLLTAPLFEGYGGKLGAIAFISLLVVFFLIQVIGTKAS